MSQMILNFIHEHKELSQLIVFFLLVIGIPYLMSRQFNHTIERKDHDDNQR